MDRTFDVITYFQYIYFLTRPTITNFAYSINTASIFIKKMPVKTLTTLKELEVMYYNAICI